MLYRLMLCLCVVGCGVLAVPAQRTRPLPASNAASDSFDDDDRAGRLGRPEEEMLKRRRVEQEKKEYRDHLTRAREAATLGATLNTTFQQQQTLSREDFKKLERLWKLARGIRKNMSEDSDEMPLETPPATLAEGLTRLASQAESLATEVKDTPRNVVSMTVLEQASAVESLAHYMYNTWGRKDN